MSLNTLQTAYSNGDIIDSSHINELTLALLGSFVGRNSSGIPASGQSLGTLALPWGNVYASGLVLNGLALDTSTIVSSPNRIVSGKTRSLSSMPDFIRANGAALSFQILGATTNLLLSINNTATTINTDITKTGFTAAPTTNNTCLVNDATMTNDKYAGEEGTEIIIDTVGTEISSRVGQIVAFKRSTEIMLGYIKSATVISDVYRGFFFDSSGNPIVRENLSNNDSLTILSTGWVFVENNGTTVDVSYRTPVVAFTSPSAPVTGDYWYDLANNVWKRYSGASWEIINRILVGVVAADGTACIGSRSFDFSNSFSELNNVELEISTTEIIKSKDIDYMVNVYGTKLFFQKSFLSWNITTNLESPLTEASSTIYYLYISDKGQSVISTEKPYYRPDLSGYYHPFHSWRCMGKCFNDGSSNLTMCLDIMAKNERVIIKDQQPAATTSGTSGAGVYVTRRLNTVEGKIDMAILNANQFRLMPGKYYVEFSGHAWDVNAHMVKIQNITLGTAAVYGQAAYATNGGADGCPSHGFGEITITKDTNVFELQHYTAVSEATNGLGQPANGGGMEIFGLITILRMK